VLVHGLLYFGQVFADFMSGDGWQFEYYPDQRFEDLLAMASSLNRCDLVYQIGGRITMGKFLRAARFLRKSNVVMHWVGSDTLDQREAFASGQSDQWVASKIHHWADSEWIYNEVCALGIPCKMVPLPSAKIPERPSPPSCQFSVLVYVPSVERAGLYGLDMILEAARCLPEVRFELVGLRDGPIPNPPPNINFHQRLPDLSEFYRRASVIWRPARHDGLSWMVMEALGHGRHVLWSYPFPGCILTKSASDAIMHISRLFELHKEERLGLNYDGVRFIAKSEYHPRRFRADIRSRLVKILGS
jgi:hypothetical protein